MTSFPKNVLIRMVAQDGHPVLDESGRMDGRGAYLCCSVECLEKAMKKKNVFSALGISMSADERDAFRERFASFCSDREVKE